MTDSKVTTTRCCQVLWSHESPRTQTRHGNITPHNLFLGLFLLEISFLFYFSFSDAVHFFFHERFYLPAFQVHQCSLVRVRFVCALESFWEICHLHTCSVTGTYLCFLLKLMCGARWRQLSRGGSGLACLTPWMVQIQHQGGYLHLMGKSLWMTFCDIIANRKASSTHQDTTFEYIKLNQWFNLPQGIWITTQQPTQQFRPSFSQIFDMV